MAGNDFPLSSAEEIAKDPQALNNLEIGVHSKDFWKFCQSKVAFL